jgi:signal transduction histidine kinase
MPPEVVSRVFKPYYTTKPGGSGLGLATTRKIIEAHGGTIGVDSEPTRGTCFTITLPVFGDETQNGVQEPTQEPIHVKKRSS